MKGFIYIIQSKKTGRYYIGSTSDVSRRLQDHNSSNTPSTKAGKPWILRLSQEYGSLVKARKIEKHLKKLKRRDYLERIIAEGIVKLSLSGCSSDG